jgi:hypothetical protein
VVLGEEKRAGGQSVAVCQESVRAGASVPGETAAVAALRVARCGFEVLA